MDGSKRPSTSASAPTPEWALELQNAIALLLETKPEDPVQFMAKHFHEVSEPSILPPPLTGWHSCSYNPHNSNRIFPSQ